MNQHPTAQSPVDTRPADGRFHRAQGGRCDFRPAFTTMASPDTAGADNLRAVYPCPALAPEGDGWVRVRC